ncbi:putative DsbA family dithiol-disulfide isomerase [Actinoalloteichus hoggarensis]|uniref:DSBA-like thioredoxin domain protein n=1 Tax=Actinoalloteichus hoggarensis TaxID=1470176 RepID=A0A221W6B3_9PSEU|nr:DsbA family oxidoreductase [Actinoalloteichus hoggarensis]ASO21274.1 DSBA-like thioredoxin domain protein [Actinoalloteichus hoggarensis]MBB5921206.1 putative DsbA family dithiol-disulfide isomerase [Actinoalloteichus hoggarensis]
MSEPVPPNEALKVDIFSDINCPWCYIGKRRFEAAVAQAGENVLVEYRSYELAPDTPVDFEGTSAEYLHRSRGMPADQVEQRLRQVTDIAAAEGLAYDMPAVRHSNTRKAHRLLHHAKETGVQAELKERLLSAHFEQGRNVGRDEELLALAVEVGLDRDRVSAVLASDEYEDAVEQDLRLARQYGIQGVPFFVIDGRYGVSGAQESEAFVEVLRTVRAGGG